RDFGNYAGDLQRFLNDDRVVVDSVGCPKDGGTAHVYEVHSGQKVRLLGGGSDAALTHTATASAGRPSGGEYHHPIRVRSRSSREDDGDVVVVVDLDL